MKKLLLLFKKDAILSASAFKQNKLKRDTLGTISSALLLVVVYGVFIYVYKAFSAMYLATTFGSPSAESDRVCELLTYVFGAVFAVNIVVGTRKIYKFINESRDCDVLMFQPIGARTIFLYKLIKIYASQFLSSCLILIPVAIVADIQSVYVGGVGFYFLLAFTLLLLPMLSCAIASLISIPYTLFMRLIDSRFIVYLALYIVILGVFFWIYGLFLSALSELLGSGEINFIFDRNTINSLHSVSLKLFPSNLFANILFGTKVWQSALILIALAAGAVVLTYFVVQKIYTRTLQRKMEGGVKAYRNTKAFKKRSVTATLLHKEFLVVLRTPSYAFQYFATSVTLSFMVYICVNLMRSMMSTLTVIDCDYELSVFVISMFCILTNTFCTTNISRDGRMFAMLKTMPLRCKDVIKCKLIFCSIVSGVSVLASVITLAAIGYLNAWQSIFVFVIAMLLSLAEMAYATRKDLNAPDFPTEERDEVTESNSNISSVVLIGLFVSIIAGGGSLALSTIMGLKFAVKFGILASMGFVTIIVLTVFVLAFVYLFRGLEEKYHNSEM